MKKSSNLLETNLCPDHESVHGPFDSFGAIVRQSRVVHPVWCDIPVETLDDFHDVHLACLFQLLLLVHLVRMTCREDRKHEGKGARIRSISTDLWGRTLALQLIRRAAALHGHVMTSRDARRCHVTSPWQPSERARREQDGVFRGQSLQAMITWFFTRGREQVEEEEKMQRIQTGQQATGTEGSGSSAPASYRQLMEQWFLDGLVVLFTNIEMGLINSITITGKTHKSSIIVQWCCYQVPRYYSQAHYLATYSAVPPNRNTGVSPKKRCNLSRIFESQNNKTFLQVTYRTIVQCAYIVQKFRTLRRLLICMGLPEHFKLKVKVKPLTSPAIYTSPYISRHYFSSRKKGFNFKKGYGQNSENKRAFYCEVHFCMTYLNHFTSIVLYLISTLVLL